MHGDSQAAHDVGIKHDRAIEDADRQERLSNVFVIFADLRAELLGAGGDFLLGVQHAFDVIFFTLQSNQPFLFRD